MPTAKVKLASGTKARLTPRGLAMVAAAACLVIVVLLAWRMRANTPAATAQPPQQHAETAPAPSTASEVHADVVTPNPHGLGRKTVQPGTVHAFEYADLFAKTSGYLGEQSVDIGDHVKRGQLLATIDVPELKAGVDEAQASLARAQSAVAQTEARLLTQRAEAKASLAMIKQSESDVLKAKAQVVYRGSQYDRIKSLVLSQSVEKKLEDEQRDAYESSKAALQAAQASVDNAQAQSDAAQARVKQAEADVEHAKAEVEVAKAVLEKAQVLWDYTNIKSPYDGVITARHFHRGAFILSADQGGTVPLLTVARTDLMRDVIQVPDTDVPYVNKGDKATIEIDALPGKTFVGEVSRMASSENPRQKTMRVEVDLPNPDSLLREGMYGGATIELEPPSEALTVPSSALVEKTDSKHGKIYVVRDGKAQLLSVTLGQDDGRHMEILKGLDAKDQVIVSYRGKIEEGAPVVVSEAAEKKH
ncbi:MAG TPA: efflux RND transporter periplasmic adaptor subunit [Pirellulales bacterium]|nr:efflux RND transporter periplasmic adaptor subunit [Pirellulales bacterium]